MNHQKQHLSSAQKRTATRNQRTQEILEMVKTACERQQGMSLIGDGYVVVDTTKFKVMEK